MTAAAYSEAEAIGKDDSGKTAIVAHRGYWNCEEAGYARNSVAALRCAQEAGFWGSEFDVNMTSDGVLLIYHDNIIDGKVIDLTPYEEFKGYRLENGEPIPTIDDYLSQVRKHPGTVMVYELKGQSSPEADERLVTLTAEKLKEYGLDSPDKVIFISFRLEICRRIAELMPGYTVQYLGNEYSPDELHAMGITGVDFYFKTFDEHQEWFSQARSNAMTVNAWTVNEDNDIRAMLELGVDMLTTDRPDAARKIFGDKEKTPDAKYIIKY